MLDRSTVPSTSVFCLALSALVGCGDSTGAGSTDAQDESGATGDSDDAESGPESGPESETESETEAEIDAESESESSTEDSDSDDTDTGPLDPLPTDVRNYIFGHSLLLHTDTQNVPMWLSQLAGEAGFGYAMSGQYGFSDTHAANLPPFAQWGVSGVPSAWDDDGSVFGDAEFNTVLFTAANFRQYYPPTETDPDGILATSVVDNTIAVFDWVEAAEPGVRFVIYENWPDMAGFTAANFEDTFPAPRELAAYHDYTRGAFHQWWLDYQDAMLLERPELDVRMVPVGPVIADLLTGVLAGVPPEAVYEDDAPHGQPTLYFLAGLVTYAAIYGEPPPDGVAVPEAVHPEVSAHYGEVVDEVWQALVEFDDARGESRVW